ncbi:MAG: hypothetical protein O7A07_07405 [Acidobacteria bacterium]|nr:hypothetical protein [Acidobacteriota bacterium]
MRPAATTCLLFMALSVMASSPLRAATRVALPASVTGQTLDGALVGSSPFAGAPAVDMLSGDLLFRAAFSGGPAPQALLRMPTGAAVPGILVAAGDEAAPGLAFDSFLAPSGCAGQVTFWSGLAAIPPATAVGSGIFILDQGQVVPVAMVGGTAPGGGTYLALGSDPRVDISGRLIYLATTSDSPDDLILFRRAKDGTTAPILTAGDLAADGSPVTELLNSDLSCTGTLLVLATLETTDGPRQTLLRDTGTAWQPQLMQGDSLPDGTTVTALRLPAAVTADGSIHLVIDRDTVPAPALVTVDDSGNRIMLAAAGDSSGSGGTLADFGPPTPLSADQVAWRSRLNDGSLPAGASPYVVLAAGPAAPATVLVAPGNASPGGGALMDLGDPVGRGNGTLHLVAGTAGEVTGEGLLTWTTSAAWSARAGQLVPGWGRLLGGGFRTARPALDTAGQAAFIATFSPGDGGKALYLAAAGALPRRLLSPGDILSGGELLAGLAGPATPSAAGVVWVAADVTAAGERIGYVRATDGTGATLELAEGDPSPQGGQFRTLGRIPAAGADDRLLFTATLSGAGSSAGIFTLDAGLMPATVTTAGAPAPDGGDFTSFGFAPAMAGTRAAFMAFTGGSRSGSGIFAADLTTTPPVLIALARSGDAAPGGGTLLSFRDPTGGEDGTVAFLASLEEGGSVILVHGTGGLQRLLATGDSLPAGETVTAITALSPDDTGTIYASVLATAAAPVAMVLALDGATTQIVLGSGGTVPLGGGELAVLQNFPALGAGGTRTLVMAAELQGWSSGAAVIYAAEDSDGDGWGDPLDCALADASAWAVPPAVKDLQIQPAAATAASLTWNALTLAAGPGTTHEILSGSIADLQQAGGPAGATCAASGIGGGTGSVVDGKPDTGTARWYMVRGRNACGVGFLAASEQPRSVSETVCAAH